MPPSESLGQSAFRMAQQQLFWICSVIPLAFCLRIWWRSLLTVPQNEELRKALASTTFPRTSSSLHEVQQLFLLLNRTRQTDPNYVHLSFIGAYVARVAWPLSGIDYMNLLAGALYGKCLGFILCTILATAGSSIGYWTAQYVKWCLKDVEVPNGNFYETYSESGQTVLAPSTVPFSVICRKLESKWSAHNDYWFSNRLVKLCLLTAMRLFPLLPLCLLNYTLALLDVPFVDFLISAFAGSIPHCAFGLVAGSHLMTLQPVDNDRHLFIYSAVWTAIAIIILRQLYQVTFVPTLVYAYFNLHL